MFEHLHDCYKEDSYNPSAHDVLRLAEYDVHFFSGVAAAAAASGFLEPLELPRATATKIREAHAESQNGKAFVLVICLRHWIADASAFSHHSPKAV